MTVTPAGTVLGEGVAARRRAPGGDVDGVGDGDPDGVGAGADTLTHPETICVCGSPMTVDVVPTNALHWARVNSAVMAVRHDPVTGVSPVW